MKASPLAAARICAAFLAFAATASLFGQVKGTALVRHAPQINAGMVDGSIQQLLPEGVTLNGGAVVTNDLLVPGLPTVRVNGRPNYSGTVDGSGAATPANYQITLNGNASLGHVVRRTNPIALPVVAAPPTPVGTRTVIISAASQTAGDFATLRHLTLNGGVGQFVVPPGTYGDFTANGGSGFTLGVAGATQPAVYNFQRLNFNGQAQLQVVGPVVINLAYGFSANGVLGSTTNPTWLTLNVYSGGFTLNGGCTVYGFVNAPNGTVTVNGNSQLIGGAASERLVVNGGGVLRLVSPVTPNRAPIANNSAPTVSEDSSVMLTLTAIDPDGDGLTYTIVQQPTNGTLGSVTTGPNNIATVVYTPAANFSGNDTFTFKARDAQLDSNVATVSITVQPSNDRPTADSKPLLLDEDTPANVILSGSDLDGDPLTFDIVAQPANGTLSGTGANRTYTPAPNFHGTDFFTYVAKDGLLTSAAATVSITVNSVNDAPVALAASHSVNEGSTVTVTMSGTDIDGDVLTFQQLSSPANGTLTGSGPSFTYKPNANYNGIDGFSFRVFDGQVYSAPASISINVTDLNFAPVAQSAPASTDEDAPITITLIASDQDGHALTYSIVTPPTHGTLGNVTPGPNNTAAVLYTPKPNASGTDSFTFRARDTLLADSNTATITVTVRPVNDAPVANSQTAQTDEDTPATLALAASDIENSPLTFSIVTQPTNGTLGPIIVGANNAATVSYTPNANFNGTDSFTFKARDAELDSAPATVSLTIRAINDAPTVSSPPRSTPEDQAIVLTLNGADVEGAALTFTANPPQFGTLSPITPGPNNTATVIYTPALNYHGPDSFAFRASDGGLSSAEATVLLTVTPVNDSPVATGQDLVQPQDTPFDFTLNATDVDGDTLTYNYTQPARGTLSGTAPNLRYTPLANDTGTVSLTFTASDGAATSNQATVTFTMTVVSYPPVAAQVPPAILNEDTSITLALSATDQNGDALTFHIVEPPMRGTLGAIIPGANNTGTVLYTPTGNTHGTDTFKFNARDAALDSNTVTVSLTINPVNDAPVASAQSIETLEEAAKTFALTAVDADGDALTFLTVTEPTKGTLTLNQQTGSVTYTPRLNENGADSFTWKARDSAGVESGVATVSINITPVNDAPIAANIPVQTDEDTSVVVTLSATDVDNANVAFSIVTAPTHGTYTPPVAGAGKTATLTYKPTADYNGSDSLTYKASDGDKESTATVSITVRPVNDQPKAQSQTVSAASGSASTITLTGSDIDSPTLTFAIVQAPQHGTLSVVTAGPNNTASVTYRSAADFGGFDSFTFKTNDGQLDSAPATVQITSGLPPRSKTYTTTGDFVAGALVGVDTATADQISNKVILASFDTVWIANSSKGTIIKLDSETGRVIGEFLSAPSSVGAPYPSRIAIDSKGNAWVANLSHDSIVKVGDTTSGAFVDRNHNGKIDTSSELGDVFAWTDSDLTGAADEAILLYVRTEVSGVKQISVDADDNVWVGGQSGSWQKFDGKTGALITSEPSIGQGGNGGYIAADGKMYSASRSFLIWNTAQAIASLPQDDNIRAETWASALDSKGNLWTTRDWTSTVMKYSPTGELLGEYYHGEPWAMGIAIDANDHVWVAHSHCGHSVGHLLPDGQFLGNVEVANHGPVEVSIDRRGRIWVVSSTGVVERINPLAGALGSDGITPIGEVDVRSGHLGGSLWTYGRFTGSAFGLASPDGLWTNVYDGQLVATTWGPIVANGQVANDGKVEIEAALSADGITFGPFLSITLAAPSPAGSGRYLKTRVRLVSSTTGETPVLHDLTVGTAGYTTPSTTPSWSISAGADIAGNWPDVIQLKGAFVHSLHAFPTEPTYAWSVVTAPSGANVTFSNAATKRPTAQFTAQGTYVLRLTATLGTQTSTDDVQVVLTPYNRAPYPNAGYTIFRADHPPQLWLWGSVRDDGLPIGGTVTTQWEKLFGPGTVTFTNPAAAATTASFSESGVYVLRLKAFDGELTGEDVTTVWLGYSCIPTAPDGLVSWWQAAGNGDDHIGGNQAFTERGADYTEGKIGGAFRFDGSNDRVRVFSAPTLDVGAGQGMSLEFWVNPSADRTATIFEYGQNATHGFSVRQLGRAIEANFREANGTNHAFATGTVLTVGTWTHITVSYNRAAGEGRIYVNGTPAAAQTVGTFTLSTAYDIFMGGASNLTEYFAGLLDEVSVYNRALYADEVTAIVSHPAGKRPPVSNVAPIVNAGPDLAGKPANTAITLAGTVTDDGQPTNGSLFIKWSKISGPGIVSFGNDAQPSTTATFSEGGVYVLKLFADDGGFCTEDLVEVRVGSLYKFDTNSDISAWWMANDTDLDAVRKLKMERFNGMIYGTGQAGQGFLFDGSNDYGRVAAHSALDLGASTAGLTIEFWAKPSQIGADKALIHWGTPSQEAVRIWQYDNGGRNLHAAFRDTSEFDHVMEVGGFFTTANTWVHAAITYDRVTGIGRIYRNGILVLEQNLGVFRPKTALPVTFGADRNGNINYAGVLDEITFYTRPLKLEEIQAIYQGGNLGKVPLDNNTPTAISAGPDVIVLSATGTATLSGTVVDDGRPAGNALAISWSKVEGPGTVVFADQNAPSTTATFSQPGTYVLQLAANDGLNQGLPDTIVVRVGVQGVEPDAALAAWWPANGKIQEVVRGNHDVEFLPKGVAFAQGQVAQGFFFDGVSDRGRVAAHADLDVGASAAGMTVEFWVKPAQIGADKALVVWGSPSQEGVRIWQYDNGGRNLHAAFRDTSEFDHAMEVGGFFGTANVWLHAAVTYDRVTGIGRIYRNGVLVLEQSLGVFRPKTNQPMVFGADRNGNSNFSGVLDEISLYSRPLTLEEIQAIYLAAIIGKTPIDDNAPPVINAGPDLQVVSAAATVALNGSVLDDGKPLAGTLSITWSKVSGPGTVAFANPNLASTNATFSLPGSYVLRLDANDGMQAGKGDIVVVRIGVQGGVEPDAALAAWWPANNDVREVVRGNHDVEFIPKSVTYAAGQVADGFLFDGVSDRGRVAAHTDLDVGASAAGMTVEFWVKPAQIGADKALVVWGSPSQEGVRIWQYDNGGRNLHAAFRDTSEFDHAMEVGGFFGTANVWLHAAVTYDRVTGIGRIYRNGVLVLEQSLGVFRPKTNVPMVFGADRNGNSNFSGVLDEISIYTRPLSLEEIRAIFFAGASGKTPLDDNRPPVINAGPDKQAVSPTATVALDGTVTDDGRPTDGTLAIAWSLVSGPGTANFANPNIAATTATFSAPGTYILRLDANDGVHQGAGDTMVVRVGVNAGVEPEAALAAWWPANGDVHEVLRGNHDVEFIPKSVTFGAGQVGQGFVFDGVSDRGRVAAHSDLDVGASASGMTVEFWVRPGQIGNDKALLVWGSPSQEGVRIWQYDNGGRNLNVTFRDLSEFDHGMEYGGFFSTPGVWLHVGVTYDRVTGIARLYRNGVLVLEQNLGVFRPKTNQPMVIGADRNGNSNFLGTMDEIAIYGRPLLLSEIQAIYLAGAAGKAPLDSNQPPSISAGPDLQVPNPAAAAVLSGSVLDDGRPGDGVLTVAWSKLEGPGTVTFTNSAQAATTATFSAAGTYVLQLGASDGVMAGTPDTVVVRVGVQGGVEPDPALAAWWPGNGDVHEVVRGNHDIEFVPKNVLYGLGQVGQGFVFDGTSDRGRIAAHSHLDVGASATGMTVEFWIKPGQIGVDKSLLVWGSSSQEGVRIAQYDNGGRNLNVTFRDTGEADHGMEYSGFFTTPNVWLHVGVTYDRVTGVARIFRDGALVLEQNLGVFQPKTALPMVVGGDRNGNSNFLGMMDEICLYTRPLAAKEITAIYLAGIAGKAPIDDNQPPVLNAGLDQQIASGGTATLAGLVVDDARPANGTLTTTWSLVEGPGTVTFTNASVAATTATFSADGTYVLRLDASDGISQAVSDTVVVRVGVTTGVAPDSALAAWWGANGDVNELVHGGHEAEFLPRGVTFGTGQVGQGFVFDGSRDRARIAAHSDLDIGASAAGLTVEFWVKPSQIGADKALIHWGTGSAEGVRIWQYDNGGRNLNAIFRDTGGGDHGIEVGGFFTATNVWVHAAVTYDRTTGDARIFRNGVQVLQQNLGIFRPQTTLPLTLGADRLGNLNFAGVLDEICLYTRPLAAADILAIYTAGAAGKIPLPLNQPPLIVFAAPSSGSSVVADTALTLGVFAGDTDGTIAKVEFFDGATKLGETTTAQSGQPLAFNLSLPAGISTTGRHLLRAVATDNGGATAGSGTVLLDVRAVEAPRNDPGNVLPTIAFVGPPSGAAFVVNTPISFNALAADTDGAVAKVEFYDGTTKLGETTTPQSGQPTAYDFALAAGFGSLGRHVVTARAIDNAGGVTVSGPLLLDVVPVLPLIAITSPANNSAVPANTALTLQAGATYSLGAIARVEFFDGPIKLGESTTPTSGSTYAWIVAAGLSGGSHTLTARAVAADGAAAISAAVVVNATTTAPAVALTAPANNATLAVNQPFTLAATATDADGTIARVEFFRGNTKIGEVLAAPYTLSVASGLAVGTYSFTAKATDNSGLSTTSAVVNVSVTSYTGDPVSEIVTPIDGARIAQPTAVMGIIAHASLASWALDYRLKAAEGTPAEAWVTFASGSSFVGTPPNGSTPGVAAPIASFDPTSLINGIYELRLRVIGSSGDTNFDQLEPRTVIVEGNMKTGAFSVAFEDLKVPVAGIPITVARTYDSRDTRVGDFGPGWRLALNNIRVQKNRHLGTEWNQYAGADPGAQFPSYFTVPGRDRIVTIVFPDGETRRFRAGVFTTSEDKRSNDDDNESFLFPATTGEVRFYPIGDTTGKLEPLDASNQLFNEIYLNGTGTQPLSTDPLVDIPFNTSRFRLTTSDGTVFILDEALGLLEMRDLDGNTLVLNRDGQNRVTGVTSTQNAPGGAIVRSVTIVRDATGRVDYVRDPAGKDLDYIYDAQGRLASFTNREMNITQFRYENATFPYYLTRIIDPRGVAALRSEYDPITGKLVKQIDADGKETVFSRGAGVDAASRFEKVKDRLGNETTFYYDERGNVTLKIDPLGAQTTSSYYPDSDRVKFETDHYGNVKSFAYDDRGNVVVQTIGASASEDPANPTIGYTTRTTYNAQSAPTQITDPDGRVQTFTYDPETNNLLTHTVGVGGGAPATTTYTYKSDGTLDTITDALGNVTGHAYDYAFNDSAYPGAVKQTTVAVTDPAGAPGSDPTNAAATVIRVTRTLFDPQENQLAQIVRRTLPDGSTENVVTRFVYDSENRLRATIMPDGRVTETRYTSFGKQDRTLLWKSVADYQAGAEANARVTSTAYDTRGNQTSTTFADGTTEQVSFDLENRKTWSQDRRGYRTFFVYDAVGRLRFTIHPDANDGVGSGAPTIATDPRLADNPRSETQYDLIGRVRFQIDERGAKTEFTYENGCGCAMRRKQMIQHRTGGNLVTYYDYDKAGNVRFVTDPRGNTTETRYDEQGRPRLVVYPATDEHPSTQTETKYDKLGRRVEVIDQEGKTTRYRYDALGRLAEVRQYLDAATAASDASYQLAGTHASVVSTQYRFDELGNQTAQIDALGRTTSYETDQLGRRVKRILPKDATESAFLTETLAYDEWGNLWKRVDFAGKTTTFGYDALNRLKSKSADPTHPSLAYSHAIARVEYDYDANGARIAARTFGSGNTSLYAETTPRDERGRVDYKDTAAGRLDYSYYANNLLKDVVSSNTAGVNIGYRYDELNRLASVDDASTGLPARTTSYAYNANGSLETLTQPNGVAHTYAYDMLNRLRGLVVAKSGTLIHSYEYKLRASGHRRQVIEGAKTTTYTYDELYRLTQESIAGDLNSNNGDVGYTLDKVGNRLARSSQLSTINPQLNQSYNARDWQSGDTYTPNGSTLTNAQLSALNPQLSGTDTYDFEERLILRTKADGSTINISYNADGHRIAKTLLNASAQPTTSTTWLVDTNNLTGYAQVLEEQVSTASATTLRVYTYGTSLISQATSLDAQAATLRYYATDGHGNVRELTDAGGAVTDRYDYDAFGNLTFSSGTTANAYRYCGEQYDADLGLYYLRARYLNTDSGRFWSMDSYEGGSSDPASLHKYLYASANPVTFIDPSGNYTLGQVIGVIFVVDTLAHLALASTAVALNPSDENKQDLALEVAFSTPWGKMVRLGAKGIAAGHSFISRIYTETLAAGAFLGRAARKNYTKTFFLAFPHLKGKVVVHHAVEQQVLTRYPGLLTEEALNSLENLRGVPNAINDTLHLSGIRKIWDEFYAKYPPGKPPTLQQLLDQVKEIDDLFGHFFDPPIR